MKIIKHIPQKAIDESFYILVQSDIERWLDRKEMK